MFSKKAFLVIFAVLLILSAGIFIAINLTKTLPPPQPAAHTIAPGESFDDNPLKGFLPYSYSIANFPHSMEWFYLPMSAFYSDPDSTPETKPDWTELENGLNEIAGRGHQAVFRVYLDYPSASPEHHPPGIPQFLLKPPYNLEAYEYTDYGNLISKCPDYSNIDLRETIQNFIAEFGKKYDGDGRIGFITAGILGFWGEWHTAPATLWQPRIEVYNEVTNAYDKAFTKTKILFRYPRGDNKTITKFGFHDDSFCYSTLPDRDFYNFMSLLRDAGPECENRWQAAPIGGELRPEIQKFVFENEPWIGGNGEKWEDCVDLAHPTWLLNEAIKTYSGQAKENAIKAAKQMGYDFTVTSAYFSNLSSRHQLYLGIDIKNIGIAPFYYDHTMWPVEIGVKKDGRIISSWITEWDLNTIAADGQVYSFHYTTPDRNGLPKGTYNMCIRVVNPIPNGKKLGFANTGQNEDGWLDLGTFNVK